MRMKLEDHIKQSLELTPEEFTLLRRMANLEFIRMLNDARTIQMFCNIVAARTYHQQGGGDYEMMYMDSLREFFSQQMDTGTKVQKMTGIKIFDY